MRLYLVRHGQTSWNIGGRAQGHTNISLDPTGLDQARLVGRAFEGVQVDRILCSDLARCTETAEPISRALGLPFEPRRDLRERAFGEWEGNRFADVSSQLMERAQAAGISAQQVRPPGGESFEDVWLRLEPLHEWLKSTDDSVAIVSHGGTLSILLARLILGTLDSCRAFRHGNTAITELERRADGLFLILRYSDTAHLAPEPVLSGSRDGSPR